MRIPEATVERALQSARRFRRADCNTLEHYREWWPESYRYEMAEMRAAIEAVEPDLNQIWHDALKRSGMDVSPCRMCGEPVICIPDGLTYCEECAEKEEERQK